MRSVSTRRRKRYPYSLFIVLIILDILDVVDSHSARIIAFCFSII